MLRSPGNANLPIGGFRYANREIGVPGAPPAPGMVFHRGTWALMRGLASSTRMVR